MTRRVAPDVPFVVAGAGIEMGAHAPGVLPRHHGAEIIAHGLLLHPGGDEEDVEALLEFIRVHKDVEEVEAVPLQGEAAAEQPRVGEGLRVAEDAHVGLYGPPMLSPAMAR